MWTGLICVRVGMWRYVNLTRGTVSLSCRTLVHEVCYLVRCLVGWLVTDCIVNIGSKGLKLLGSVGDPVLRKEETQGKKKERKREREIKEFSNNHSQLACYLLARTVNTRSVEFN
jgi:hypothetical protein